MLPMVIKQEHKEAKKELMNKADFRSRKQLHNYIVELGLKPDQFRIEKPTNSYYIHIYVAKSDSIIAINTGFNYYYMLTKENVKNMFIEKKLIDQEIEVENDKEYEEDDLSDI